MTGTCLAHGAPDQDIFSWSPAGPYAYTSRLAKVNNRLTQQVRYSSFGLQVWPSYSSFRPPQDHWSHCCMLDTSHTYTHLCRGVRPHRKTKRRKKELMGRVGFSVLTGNRLSHSYPRSMYGYRTSPRLNRGEVTATHNRYEGNRWQQKPVTDICRNGRRSLWSGPNTIECTSTALMIWTTTRR